MFVIKLTAFCHDFHWLVQMCSGTALICFTPNCLFFVLIAQIFSFGMFYERQFFHLVSFQSQRDGKFAHPPRQFPCICRTSLVCFGTLVFCSLLFLKSKLDRWQSSGVEVRWSLRKFKKGKTFYGGVHVCTYWCFDFFFFSAVDRLSFFLWWEKESESRQIIWALLSVCIYLFFAFNRAIAIKKKSSCNMFQFHLFFVLMPVN